jgi:hypothetical protein
VKIDFNKDKSMNIKLDKIPSLLYINEEGEGCGQVYLDGKRIKALYEANIHAKTRESKGNTPLEYLIKYYDSKSHSYKTMGNGSKPIFQVAVSLKDAEVFNEFANILVDIVEDDRVPSDVKYDIGNRIKRLTNKEE